MEKIINDCGITTYATFITHFCCASLPSTEPREGRVFQNTAQIFIETLIKKNPTQVFSTFLNILEMSLKFSCLWVYEFSTKTEKYKLVAKVAWKICSHIESVKSKKWTNLLWMCCKSDTALLKLYKNLIK